MGEDYTLLHAADLAAMLPHDARCIQKENPITGWGKTDELIAMVELRLSEILYLLSNFGNDKPKGKVPEPIFAVDDTRNKKQEDDRIIVDTDTYMKLREKILKGDGDVN